MISRIDVEPATGRVLAFAVHKGGVLGFGGTTTTMDADAIISLGPELVTVRQVPTEDTP